MRRDINNEDRQNVANDNAKCLARVAREKSRAEKRDLAGLRDEEKREETSPLQRRGRGSALFRLDRRNSEVDRRKLFCTTVQSAAERDEPALGDEQGARPTINPRRIDDAGRNGKNSRPDERGVRSAAGHRRGAQTRPESMEELPAFPEMVSAGPRWLARYVPRP